MGKNLFIFSRAQTPRWIVFVIDLFICLFSITLAFLLRFNFSLPKDIIGSFIFVIPFVLIVRAITFFLFKSYANLIRYTSLVDTQKVFVVVSTGSIIFVCYNLLNRFYLNGSFVIPFSVIIIDFLITTFIMTSSRVLIKNIYHEIVNPSKAKSNVIIFGADQYGATVKRTLDRDVGEAQKVIAFIDNDKKKAGKKLEGITIFHTSQIDEILDEDNILNLIVSSKNVDINIRNEVIDRCLQHKIKVFNVPDPSTWINGELSYNQIKGIKIEDLLERDPIKLDLKLIRKDLINKTVLVTGAAGSIGGEIVRQVIKFYPRKILLFDQAESPLYDLELELTEKHKFENFEIIIGDITNYYRLARVFEVYKPNIVYHTAAYKHVPMMEKHPSEAILVNVWGTKNVADLAVENKVSKFVMVSTDKAVNPTNVMGASKRIAEIYIQTLNQTTSTHFITTRFGNVLGSNGSVIPRFRKQIESGGPVTITHPEVTRYFMTIPEACQLVIEAGAMGKGGEIYLFDMGESVKILDLAKKMLNLYGLTIGKDIRLNYTGLRPGEKLYEELLSDKENTLPTHHPQIMIAKVQEHDTEKVKSEIKKLLELLVTNNDSDIVKQMKKLVPEFKSQNSIFEELDIETEEVRDSYNI